MTEKSKFLQAIRAQAILFVLIFHLRPNFLPNGYLGVDMFFVLSGYLITKMLSISGLDKQSVKLFYEKRIKRIIPLYLITVVLILLFGILILLDGDLQALKSDSLWALFYASNMKDLFEKTDYFTQLTLFKPFTHTWSLATELHFYLFAPLFFKCYLNSSRQTKALFSISVFLASFCLFQILDKAMYFGFLPCRIWQFMIGLFVYEIEINSKTPENPKNSSHNESFYACVCYLIFLALFLIVKYSFVFLKTQTFVITLLTGLLIFCSTQTNLSPAINSPPIQYLGDISYSLYLIHWPVIVYYKYSFFIDEYNGHDLIIVLLIIFLMTILVHHTLEKCFIKGKLIASLCVIGVCYMAFFALYLLPAEFNGKPLTSLFYQFRKNNNRSMSARCQQLSEKVAFPDLDYLEEPYREMRGKTSGNGTYNVLLLGNSFMRLAFPQIFTALDGRFKSMEVITRSACYPLLNHSTVGDTEEFYEDCDESLKTALELVKELKPRLIIISIGYIAGFKEIPFNATRDRFVENSLENLAKYSNFTDYIFIDLPVYRVNANVAERVIRMEKFGMKMEDCRNDMAYSVQDYLLEFQQAILRLDEIKKFCKKCHFIELQSFFCQGNRCSIYDDKCQRSYYQEDGLHLSEFGRNLLLSNYKAKIDNIFKLLYD